LSRYYTDNIYRFLSKQILLAPRFLCLYLRLAQTSHYVEYRSGDCASESTDSAPEITDYFEYII